MEASTKPTRTLLATDAAIDAAVETLKRGGLVAFPTETVYGLGADAENDDAVRSIFAAKGRPADHPVIVHLADAAQLSEWAAEIPDEAHRLAQAFWPGPMTLVLRRGCRASDLVTGGLETVGLRVPSHPVAHRLLERLGGGIAAPSANRFGRVSPTSAQHVRDELAGRIDLILDGGPCQVGLESTIIDLSRPEPAILRPGGVTAEQVAQVLKHAPLELPGDRDRVSGSLPSHYAPRAIVELVTAEGINQRARELASQGLRVAVVAPEEAGQLDASLFALPWPRRVDDLARDLYALLRNVDAAGCDVVLATLPEETGLGAAVADRLRKAAGPRPENGAAP